MWRACAITCCNVLRFFLDRLPVLRVRPQENLLASFQGWLRHEVTAAQFLIGTCRMSLVTEHYVLDDVLLACVPEFAVRSSRGFDGFLEAALEGEAALENDEGLGAGCDGSGRGGECDPSTP